MSDVITLAHGSGGRKTSELIAELFKKNLGNEYFTADDAAVMPKPEGRIAMSTDGFIVSPWEFNGGNIGKLSICGTVNDLACMGAKPLYLTCSYIVEEGFPVSHASGMVEVSNDWTQASQAMIVGGKDSNGNVLNAVWGYDGTRWGKISNNHGQELPGLCDATLFRYYTYTQLKGVRRYGLQNTWFIMGGQLADGSLNDAIYLSNSQGVTWASGDTTYFQPSHMPKFYGAQAFVHSETMTASGANYLPRRVQSLSATWDCPYLYLFGGYGEDDALLPNVWRGVYIRLTNSPID